MCLRACRFVFPSPAQTPKRHPKQKRHSLRTTQKELGTVQPKLLIASTTAFLLRSLTKPNSNTTRSQPMDGDLSQRMRRSEPLRYEMPSAGWPSGLRTASATSCRSWLWRGTQIWVRLEIKEPGQTAGVSLRFHLHQGATTFS